MNGHWKPDPQRNESVENPFGGLNSVSFHDKLVLRVRAPSRVAVRLLVYAPAWNRILPFENLAQQRGDGCSPLVRLVETPWLRLTEKLGRINHPSNLSHGRICRHRV